MAQADSSHKLMLTEMASSIEVNFQIGLVVPLVELDK